MPFSNYVIWILGLSTAIGLVSYLTSSVLRKHSSNFSVTNSLLASSVWCNYGPSGERICRFQNLCYESHLREFQFLLSSDSVVSGVQNESQWMNIDMSAVLEHNAFKLKISILSPVNSKLKRSVTYHNTPTFILHRFKPDNIMHVIHDDLIPLYATMEAISDKTAISNQHFDIAFTDDYNHAVFDDWYQYFSGSPPVKLININKIVCFSDAYIGLYRSTLWYKYGFKDVQGPHHNDNFNSKVLKNFVNFNFDIRGAKSYCNNQMNLKQIKIVVLLRSQTRRILNTDHLLHSIRKAFVDVYPKNELDIVQLDFSVHTINFILCQINQAKLIVGMHGAGMILSIFLPPLSGIVELFPFGINPENVSFLKSLLDQNQKYPLYYESWVNIKRENSVAGMHANPLLGNISHLPISEQIRIQGLSQVPAVKCCHDPAYLYYMYHDTIINDKVFDAIHTSLRKTLVNKFDSNDLLRTHVFPAGPNFVNCIVKENFISVDWSELSNAEENNGLWFQITVKSGEHVQTFNVYGNTTRNFSSQLGNSSEVTEVWFQAFNNKNIGGFINHKKCVRNMP